MVEQPVVISIRPHGGTTVWLSCGSLHHATWWDNQWLSPSRQMVGQPVVISITPHGGTTCGYLHHARWWDNPSWIALW